MSSDIPSTKVNCVSVKSHTSASQSLLGDVSGSGSSTSARKHSKTSKEPSKSSTKDLPQSSSKGSAKSSSKCSSKSSSKHSSHTPHSSHRRGRNPTLSDINPISQRDDKSTGPMSPAVREYVASMTLSNPQYALSLPTSMTEAEYQTRMLAFLDDFDNRYEDTSKG